MAGDSSAEAAGLQRALSCASSTWNRSTTPRRDNRKVISMDDNKAMAVSAAMVGVAAIASGAELDRGRPRPCDPTRDVAAGDGGGRARLDRSRARQPRLRRSDTDRRRRAGVVLDPPTALGRVRRERDRTHPVTRDRGDEWIVHRGRRVITSRSPRDTERSPRAASGQRAGGVARRCRVVVVRRWTFAASCRTNPCRLPSRSPTLVREDECTNPNMPTNSDDWRRP